MLIKGAISQEDIAIVKIYALNLCILNIIKQTLLEVKPQVNLSTIIMGDFNILLSPVDRSLQKKKSKTSKLNEITD